MSDRREGKIAGIMLGFVWITCATLIVLLAYLMLNLEIDQIVWNG